MSGSSHGPTYTHVFPAETNTTLLENSNARHPLFSTRREQPEEFNKKSPPEISKRKKSKNHVFDTPSAYSLPKMKVVLPSSWCIKAAELKLNQYMPWPVGSFSLAFWLCLDSGLVGHGDRERIARTRIPHGKRSTTFFDSRVRDRVRKPRIGSFVHVVSFGSNDALFEVWVNFSKTELICR